MNWMKENYFIALFLGLNIVFMVTILISNTLSTEEDYQIKIEHGDSLWELANKFGADEPKEAWINKVMAMNNLETAQIKAGDTLVIPEVKENYHLDYGTEIAGDGK
ncbi:LysM peptidoglycan-binding domain-containing protein [Psychrobacillus sp. FSL H8-0484]|uniref:cell division suppressor protein YneA n=1 Tax=Psychrobacillus sp. FSL H8-0484 TaxID=2921390 RepID=UPI0030F828BF